MMVPKCHSVGNMMTVLILVRRPSVSFIYVQSVKKLSPDAKSTFLTSGRLLYLLVVRGRIRVTGMTSYLSPQPACCCWSSVALTSSWMRLLLTVLLLLLLPPLLLLPGADAQSCAFRRVGEGEKVDRTCF